MARILIVDEDPHFVRTSRGVLESQGYQVSSAEGIDEALEYVQRGRPDLVLLDGALCESRRAAELRDRLAGDGRQREMPVVVIKPASELGDGLDETAEGRASLTKPVDTATLLKAADEGVTRTAFVYSPRYAEYDYGPDHPLEPRRPLQTVELCNRYGLLDMPWIDVVEPQPATAEKMAEFHSRAYLNALVEANDGVFRDQMVEFGLGTADCPVFRGVYDYSALVAGGTLLAASLVEEGRHDLSFHLAGGFHHAQHRNAEGFCYVNDVVIAVMDLLRKGHRVAYVDLDAHHGDGVQAAFYEDERVLAISLHESGKTLFPWSGFETEIGSGKGRGYNINVPLPPQTDDEIFHLAFDEIVPPSLTRFEPDIVFTLIGADGLLVDPLSHLSMTNNAYAEAVKTIEAISPRCVVLGGGGYHLNSVARAWCLAWAVMNGIEPQDEYVGTIGGMMVGTEYVEGGGLRDRNAYTTGPLKVEIRKEVERVAEYLKETVFPLIRPDT